MGLRRIHAARMPTAAAPGATNCHTRRRAWGSRRIPYSTSIVVAATAAVPQAIGDFVRTKVITVNEIEAKASEAVTDRVRHSIAKLIPATTVSSPNSLRFPSRPEIGPPWSRLPAIPRKRMGVSTRSPENTSSTIEASRRTRSTSPKLRMIWMVSRTSATYSPNAVNATR